MGSMEDKIDFMYMYIYIFILFYFSEKKYEVGVL